MTAAAKQPLNPYLIMAVAVLLPGGGHVLAGEHYRGLGFAFFSLLFAILSWHTTTPEHSFIGRAAGGLFVWALSIPDAYKIARMRYARWEQNSTIDDSGPSRQNKGGSSVS